MPRKVSLLLVLMVSWSRIAGAQGSPAAAGEDLRSLLVRLHEAGLWGEVVLTDGRIRAVQVDTLCGDTLTVREVIGPLQERTAVYRLDELVSARELGERRLPSRPAVSLSRHSAARALLLETLVPGAGYLSIGRLRPGLVLAGVGALAVGTGIATGKAGAAGWVPICCWLKLASLADLWDQVRAINHLAEPLPAAGRGGAPERRPGEYLTPRRPPRSGGSGPCSRGGRWSRSVGAPRIPGPRSSPR